jgi:hypothetical protein
LAPERSHTMAMTVGLSLMTLGFAVVMAIPIVGPMLL